VAEGVRPEVAFVQTMKETGFLQFKYPNYIFNNQTILIL